MAVRTPANVLSVNTPAGHFCRAAVPAATDHSTRSPPPPPSANGWKKASTSCRTRVGTPWVACLGRETKGLSRRHRQVQRMAGLALRFLGSARFSQKRRRTTDATSSPAHAPTSIAALSCTPGT